MKKFITALIISALTASVSITAFGDSGYWNSDYYGWWYQNPDGSYPVNSWKLIDGEWYHFNYSGYMDTGWINDSGTWYYLYPSGEMATGWLSVDGSWYFLDQDGAMLTGYWNIDGQDYYFGPGGELSEYTYEEGTSGYEYENAVEIEVYDIYYYGDCLYVETYIYNYSDEYIYEPDVTELTVYDYDEIAATAYFGSLDGVIIAPYGYIEYTFVFSPDSIYQDYADFSEGSYYYEIEY